MQYASCIYVAGGATLAGQALLNCLRARGFRNIVGQPPDEPDLTCEAQVDDFFAEHRPDYVFLAAGQSGGIQTNIDRPAELMLDNLLSAAHVIDSAYQHGTARLLYLASSCIYPREASQPLREDSLLTGPLEPTNDAYATAKLAGWKLCQAYRRQHDARFITAIPANPFGPGDDFSAETGHVIPAVMRRLHDARARGDDELAVWGSGRPIRDFFYAPDLADACLFVMSHYDDLQPINLGGGEEHTIAEIARLIAKVVGYRGRLRFDTSRPDGMPRKVLDASRLHGLGWRPRTDFRTALQDTYAWFLTEIARKEVAGRERAAV